MRLKIAPEIKKKFDSDNPAPDSDRPIFIDCTFDNCAIDTSLAQYISCNFKNTYLLGAQLWNNTFVNCKFVDSDFRGAILSETAFIRCEFYNCDFSPDAEGNPTDLRIATFVECQGVPIDHKSTSTPMHSIGEQSAFWKIITPTSPEQTTPSCGA